MIFNPEFLFLHLPKTAGMSLSAALLRELKEPVYYTVPKGHAKQTHTETILEGTRHENLYQARDYLQKFEEHRFPLKSFKIIFTMIRNPYDLEVSRYHYLRLGHEWDKGPAQEIALSGDFARFVVQAPLFFKVQNYLLLDGRFPENLHVLRFEGFSSEINLVFQDFFKHPLSLNHANKTERQHYRTYLTRELEQAIYKKYEFLFTHGFYSRLAID